MLVSIYFVKDCRLGRLRPGFHIVVTVGDPLRHIGDVSPYQSVTYGNGFSAAA